MAVTVVRSSSGSAADTILKLLSINEPNAKFNIQFDSLNEVGRSPTNPIINPNIPNCIKLGTNQEIIGTIDTTSLLNEINNLRNIDEIYYLKSHYFEKILNDVTIDIVNTHRTLSFMAQSNVYKTNLLQKHSNYTKLNSKIKDQEIAVKYALYNIIKDCLIYKNFSNRQISVENIIGGWDKLSENLQNLGFTLNLQAQEYYSSWLNLNLKYLPSNKYVQYVDVGYHNYNDTDLNIAERYALLALSGNKFKILQ
jgi:hypothetical protein